MVKHGYDYEEYRSKVLKNLNAQMIYKKYKDKILLCWEKDASGCHRRMVAKWIFEELGINVYEDK